MIGLPQPYVRYFQRNTAQIRILEGEHDLVLSEPISGREFNFAGRLEYTEGTTSLALRYRCRSGAQALEVRTEDLPQIRLYDKVEKPEKPFPIQGTRRPDALPLELHVFDLRRSRTGRRRTEIQHCAKRERATLGAQEKTVKLLVRQNRTYMRTAPIYSGYADVGELHPSQMVYGDFHTRPLQMNGLYVTPGLVQVLDD